MADISTKHVSYWIDSTPETSYPELPGDLSVDVAVVGAGIVGLTTALLLKRAGRSVAVIDSQKIVGQVTGRTTAKLTSLHGLIYSYLIKSFGEDGARVYAESNQAAIEIVDTIRTQLGSECDFERQAAYTVTESKEQLPALEAEREAAARLGLPVDLVTETTLPFPIVGAVRFDNQARFHPRKYLLSVAQAVDGDGCAIFENTRVLDVEEGAPCQVLTDKGKVTARDVVIATNIPILDRGGFFAKAFPRQHVVVGIRVAPEQVPDGMFLSVGEPSYSVRVHPTDKGPLLIVSGQGYPTGHADTAQKSRELRWFVQNRFQGASIEYEWVNQDYDAADRVPYIGHLTPGSKHLYTATGFSAWGLTNGTMAATILSDEIIGNHNRWAELYRATRVNLKTSGAKLLKKNVHIGEMWLKDKLASGLRQTPETVAPGEGEIINFHGKKTAVHRDETGQIHAVSAVCTHLGCIVHWNKAAKSWDCPCHGSRFDAEGKVISGPAIKNLEPESL
ncbi:FAD-dependent oxidoreductase [Methylocaldum sp.]|uniref:FAD-dependent oxidoreductase n=1 Tax=Methylocaldum sp. TaxID=1969727 RepID=UPI002D4FF0F1|nr:FAD-dependent oxidoreductase [Methylocaldum sp.]HYE34826.1 FAD-dependent oxidoreductase [Methylocaldum sp.]